MKTLLRRSTLTLVLLFGGLAPSRQAWAGNKQVNIQGKLTDAGGNPLANPTVTFRLYTGLTGGVAVWSSTMGVTTSNGLFNVSLKDGSPALDSLAFSVPYYLGMTIAGDPNGELTPRQLLGASAYALGSLGNFNVQGNLISSGNITTNGNVFASGITVSSITTGSIVFSPTTMGMMGTTTNDNAGVGVVGEYRSAIVSQTSRIPESASGEWVTIASISLTPGDWDVTGIVSIGQNWSDAYSYVGGVSIDSGSAFSDTHRGDNQLYSMSTDANNDANIVVPNYRISLATTMSVFLKARGYYSSVNSPCFYGRISARRVR